jgi:hypothetical protein
MQVTRHDFEAIGFAIMRREHNRCSDKSRMHRFVSWFGAEPIYLSITWHKLAKSGWLEHAGREAKPEHLVWAFMWLNCYSTAEIHSAQAGVDEKTLRDKVWFYVEGIARLDKILVSETLLVSVVCARRLAFCSPNINFFSPNTILTDPLGEPSCWRHWRALPRHY